MAKKEKEMPEEKAKDFPPAEVDEKKDAPAAQDSEKISDGEKSDVVLAGLGGLFDLLPDVVDLVTAFLNGDWEGMKESGKNIVLGLWNSIKETWETLKTWIGELIDKYGVLEN